MSGYILNKNILLQEAEAIALPENIISDISEYVDFLKNNGHEDFFAEILNDFLGGSGLLDYAEIPEKLQNFPQFELLFVTAALAAIPFAEERFRSKNIPLAILNEGLADIRIWCMDHVKNYGVPGLEWGKGLHWIFLRIFTGQVLRFGRLECNKSFAFTDIFVLKNRKSGKLQAVYNGDAALDKDGFVPGDTAGTVRHGERMKKLFSEIIAFPIREDGSVAEYTETFYPDEWEGFLSPSENVLSLHIPADGRLDFYECRASLRRMKEYYSSKGYEFKAFICGTWFLDPFMEKFAGSDSNMVQFRKLGLLLGPAGASNDVIYRVFGNAGLDSIKPKTGLQKKLIEYFAAGGVFRGGRIIIDPDNF